MPVFGPTSGVTKEDLFNHLVEAIDETLSGESTGWDIEYDARGEDFTPFGRIQEGLNPTELTKKNYTTFPTAGSSVNFDPYPVTVLEYQGQKYLFVRMTNSGDAALDRLGYAISQDDGFSYGEAQEIGYYEGAHESTVLAQVAFAGDPDPGYLWVHVFRNNTNVFVTKSRTPLSSPNVDGVTAVLTGTTTTGGKSFSVVDDEGDGKINTFIPRGSGAAVALLQTTWAAYNNTPSNSLVNQNAVTAAGIGVTAIQGVDYVWFDSVAGKYRMRLSVVYSGTNRTIELISNTATLASTSWAVVNADFNDRLVSDGDDYNWHSAAYVPTTSATPTAKVQRGEASDLSSNVIYTFSETGGVDANPDFQGLEYEYVVFKSQHTANNGEGYRFVLLQLNPEQSSPPTVTGITDTLPIFARPVQNFSGGQPSKFFFDPIIPTSEIAGTYDALAPAIFTVPDVSADPEETHRVWVKASPRQVFVCAESTNGTRQFLHVNILEPIRALQETTNVEQRNDNITISSGGVDGAYGAVYLGRNGATESDTTNIRNDARPYYPRGFELSYSSTLDAPNTVDGKEYNFDIVMANNDSDFDTTASASYLYPAGKLYDSAFPSYIGEKETGDIVEYLSDDFMYFNMTAPTADIHAGSVIKDILIRWS